ncbi:MAG: DUF3164 family protein [Thermodesulfobacteriota bacterium]
MADKKQNGDWIDSMGDAVPARHVQKTDKKRDAMVERLFKKAQTVHQQLAALRSLIDRQVDYFLTASAAEAGMELNNPGGNYTFPNFSGNRRLIIKTNACIDFDERLQFAKTKIDSCLDRWSKGGDSNLRAVVFDAFQVDLKGRVDIKRILRLRKLQIKDREWREAMDLITVAITITGRKTYCHFQVRKNRDSEWETIRLDLAGVSGEGS